MGARRLRELTDDGQGKVSLSVLFRSCVCCVMLSACSALSSFSATATYLPTKQQQEAGVDRQERYKMDEYEERTLSVIAPEQEVRFAVPASQAHLVPVFALLRDSKFVRIGTSM